MFLDGSPENDLDAIISLSVQEPVTWYALICRELFSTWL